MKILYKHDQGFTFTEVALAVFMVGMLLTAIIGLQMTVFQGFATTSSRLQRIFLLKKKLSEMYQERINKTWKATEKEQLQEIKDPATTINYSVKKPSKESALNTFKNVHIEYVQAQWEDIGFKQKEMIINIIYYPEQQ
jgi:Tfp pilus assembly protein PilV